MGRLSLRALLVLVFFCSAPAALRAESSAERTIDRALEGGPRAKVILSFARFETRLLALCEAIGRDGRRERVANVSLFGSKNTYECGSCRVLWRTLERQCRVSTIKKTDKKKKTKKGEEEAVEAAPEVEATPTPIPLPRQRVPSPEVIDIASRLSVSMFEGEREGMMKESVDRITDMLERYGEPTAGEREYFGIVRAYLMASWSGREEISKAAPHKVEPDDPDELLE